MLSLSSPLDTWRFLIGKWKGTAKDQFGEGEGVIESTHTFSNDLGEKFITGKHEAWKAEKLVHKAASFLYYDREKDVFRRKEIFSYGFTNNEVEYQRTNTEIRFEVVTEPSPKQFKGLKWRSYIRKISENKIAMGLEASKGEGEFKLYGETIATKES